jgi:hypothetical protein
MLFEGERTSHLVSEAGPFSLLGGSASFQGVFVREKSSILEDSVTNFSWFRADPILIERAAPD